MIPTLIPQFYWLFLYSILFMALLLNVRIIILYMIKHGRPFIFSLFISLFTLPHLLCYADEESAATMVTAQPHELKVSEEAIASLAQQLPEDKFNLLKDTLLGKPFAQLDLSLLTKPAAGEKTEGTEESVHFSAEEVEKIRQSLDLYFGMLANIQKVVPLLKSLHEFNIKIKSMEDSLGNLMKGEKDAAEKEISVLKKQLESYSASFKAVANQLDLENINFEKLPGMLEDLGYEDTFYDIVHKELSDYISMRKKVDNAGSILRAVDEVEQEIEQKKQDLAAARTEEEKTSISEEIKKLIERKSNLQRDFSLTTTGIDTAALDEKTTKKINVEEELDKVLSPLIVGLTKFTEPARRIEFLRSNIAYYEQHVPKMREGIAQLDVLLGEARDNKVKTKLTEEKTYWENQEKEFSTKLEVVKQQLIELENRKLSPADAFHYFVQAIFSKRGMNIMFSLLLFVVVLVAMLLLRRLIRMLNPFCYIPRLHFIASLFDVFLYLLAFVVATLTLMVSLYAAGEILALLIVVVIVFGMIWVARDTLPKFFEQIKLLLGYGPVRQGERVIHDGIPWLVESIGIYSYLKNPLLTGGTLRLPVKDLVGMRSRPCDERESWFPCKEGDYVLINYKDWRQVIQQTPQRVKFEWYKMEESMPTSSFLAQKIFNLSDTPFWVGGTLYIAYDHRFIVFDEIVKQLGAFLEEEFKKLPFAEYLLCPWVDCAEMTDTSLGVMAWVQVRPEAAFKYGAIQMEVVKICMRAANKFGWEIKRFHQIEQRNILSDGTRNSSLPLD